jgi:MFS transporter, DHA1 family, multidrug resistance protein
VRKEITLLLSSVLILVYGTYIAGTILTPYAKSLGATGIAIGIISGALYIVRLFVGTSIGRLADKKGALTVLKYSL